MKFSFSIKLSTYRLLIKRGPTVEKMRAKDFSHASFYGASFDGASFDRVSFDGARFVGARFVGASFSHASFYGASFYCARFDRVSFDGASLNIVGLGVQLKIGQYRASFVGKYLSVGCVTRTVKTFAKGSVADYAEHEEGAQYRDAIQKTIKAVFAMKRAARVKQI